MALKKQIFKFRPCFFAISKLSPLGKGCGPTFEQNWFPFTQGCVVPVLAEIGSVVLEKKNLKLCCIFAISLLSALGKGPEPLIWRDLNLYTKGCFVIGLVEIGPMIFFNFVKVIYHPLEKGWGHSFERTWILFTKWCFVPSLGEIVPVVLEKIFV